MNWLVFGGSLAAVLALGGVAAWLKLGGVDRSLGDAAEAMRAAEDALSGFDAIAAAVGADGRAALVIGAEARVAVLKAHGARVVAREIGWRDVRSTERGIVIETAERGFGAVTLSGVDALDIRRLAPQLTSL